MQTYEAGLKSATRKLDNKKADQVRARRSSEHSVVTRQGSHNRV